MTEEMKQTKHKISQVLPGSIAEELELEAGDLVLAINDQEIDDIFDYCDTLLKNNITMAYIPPNILEETYSILTEHKENVALSKILIGVEPIKTNVIMKYFLLNPNMICITKAGDYHISLIASMNTVATN